MFTSCNVMFMVNCLRHVYVNRLYYAYGSWSLLCLWFVLCLWLIIYVMFMVYDFMLCYCVIFYGYVVFILCYVYLCHTENPKQNRLTGKHGLCSVKASTVSGRLT